MTARPYAVGLFLAGAASLMVLWDLSAAIEVLAGGMALLWGLQKEDGLWTTAGAWFLYLPIGFALDAFIPGVWSFIVAALAIIGVSEMMNFELVLSVVVYSAKGVDSETEALARSVSSAHLKDLGLYFVLVTPILVLSSFLSGVTQYAPEFFAGAVLLFLVLIVYARR